MENWAKYILLNEENNISYPFREVVNFLNKINLEAIDKYTESWESFNKYLDTQGFSEWDNHRKQLAKNTYILWKKENSNNLTLYLESNIVNFDNSYNIDTYLIEYNKLKKNRLKNISNHIKMIKNYLRKLSNIDDIIIFEEKSNIIDLEFHTLKLCKLLNSNKHHDKLGYINERDEDGIRIYK